MKIRNLPKGRIVWKKNTILGITGATLGNHYDTYECEDIAGNELDYEIKYEGTLKQLKEEIKKLWETTVILNKWNYETKEYDKVEIPKLNYKIYTIDMKEIPKLNYKIYTIDMKEIVNCPHCFREFEYGHGYTSKEFHNEIGLGYSVCEKCYAEEFADEGLYIQKEKKAKAENRRKWIKILELRIENKEKEIEELQDEIKNIFEDINKIKESLKNGN